MSIKQNKTQHIDEMLNKAISHHNDGSYQKAGTLYKNILKISPHNADANHLLGLVALVTGKHQQAIQLISKIVTGEKVKPTRFSTPSQVLNNLANAYHTGGQLQKAAQLYQAAIVLEPEYIEALFNLGNTLQGLLEFKEALQCYQTILQLQPDDVEVNVALSALYAAIEDYTEAKKVSLNYARKKPLYSTLAYNDKASASILVLSAIGDKYFKFVGIEKISISSGNNISDHFDSQCYSRHLLFIDYFNLKTLNQELPHYDIIFNSLSDADDIPEALHKAAKFVENSPMEVINSPATCLKTTRENNYIQLHDINNLLFPKTLRFSQKTISNQSILQQMEINQITFPVIMRQVGTHTGETTEKIDNENALKQFIKQYNDKDIIVIQYIESRNSEGLYEKARVFIVDGKIYPAHLYVSDHWNVRGPSRNQHMQQHWKQVMEIDDNYQQGFEQYANTEVQTVLTEISQRLQLDYFGVDFSVLDDNRVFVYEANCSMRHHYDLAKEFKQKTLYYDKITNAMNQMIASRIAHTQATQHQTSTILPSSKNEANNPKIYTDSSTKVGRNDLCPCGSHLKYKKCCARL